MANVNKNLVTHGFEQKLQRVKAGAEKHLSTKVPLELSGKQTTVGQLMADFDAILARYQRVRDAAAGPNGKPVSVTAPATPTPPATATATEPATPT